jgi:hypothetical protein
MNYWYFLKKYFLDLGESLKGSLSGQSEKAGQVDHISLGTVTIYIHF